MNKPRIVLTSGTCGGRPRIEGTRISVDNVVIDLKGMDPDAIAESFGLTTGQVKAAIDYYSLNPKQIDEIIAIRGWFDKAFHLTQSSSERDGVFQEYERRMAAVGVNNEIADVYSQKVIDGVEPISN